MVEFEPSIADLSSQLKKAFVRLKREIVSGKKTNSNQDDFPQGFEPERLLDLFARFLLWAENIGALQRNQSSLDFRVQHSDLQAEIVRLLKQILSAITDRKQQGPVTCISVGSHFHCHGRKRLADVV